MFLFRILYFLHNSLWSTSSNQLFANTVVILLHFFSSNFPEKTFVHPARWNANKEFLCDDPINNIFHDATNFLFSIQPKPTNLTFLCLSRVFSYAFNCQLFFTMILVHFKCLVTVLFMQFHTFFPDKESISIAEA